MKKMTPLAEVKFNDLLAFAKAHQLEIPKGVSGPALIDLVSRGLPGTVAIEVEVEEPAAVKVIDLDGGLTSRYQDDPKVTVTIMSDELSGGKHHLPISVNGDHILVARDRAVSIPYRFFLALEGMVETERRQVFDSANMRYNVEETPKKAINYSHSVPSQADIDAFHARTRDIGRGDEAITDYRRRQNMASLLKQVA